MNESLDAHYQKARELDVADPVAKYRERFAPTEPGLIYLDGNSLGRMPIEAKRLVEEVMSAEWAGRLVSGWHDWISLSERLGAKVGQIIGAKPEEIRVSDSTTVNFYKLVNAALDLRPDRRVIVTDDMNFPSDLYALQGIARQRGVEVKVVSSTGAYPAEDWLRHLDDSVALLTISHTAFKSGYVHPMKQVTAAAHAVGAVVIWDLSHSAGAVHVDLNGANADMAVGCTYKYLNGGPGAPAYLYVRKDLQEQIQSPIWGWFGRANAFDFGLDYNPAKGIQRFQAGTPPIISMSAIEPGLDLVIEAGMDALRKKSELQTGFGQELWQSVLAPFGVTFNSPTDIAFRGSHVSLGHPLALEIDLALIHKHKVIPDFRAPDNIRFGFCALYTTFEEIVQAFEAFAKVLINEEHLEFVSQRPTVT